MNLCKICIVKPYSILFIDVTLTSDKPLISRKNLSEIIQKLIITIDEKMR